MRKVEQERLNNLAKIDLSLPIKNNILSILQPQLDLNKKIAPFLAEKYYSKYYPKLLKQIHKHINLNNIKYKTFSELLYLIVNDLIDNPTCICGNKIDTFINFNNGYNMYCSANCRNTDPKLIKDKLTSYKQTCVEKYGVENVSQLDSIKKQKEDTMLSNYGVKYNSQRKEIRLSNSEMMKSKKQIIKIKNGLIKSIGVSNPSLNNNCIKNRIKTFNNKKIKRLKSYNNECDFYFIKFTNNYDILFNCNKCLNDFNISYQLLHLRKDKNHVICTTCNPLINPVSTQETEVLKFIEENYSGKIIQNDRKILNGKELDIYLPELKLAFEFNGLYWHGELHKDKDYHINKTNNCKSKDIQLIHIFQDDWEYKQDIIKSRILNLINKSTKIFARKCIIKEVNYIITKEFLIKNHIQGYTISKINLGLYYNDELVSLMTFGSRKISSLTSFELLRFCNKLNTSVVGGASKLFKYFINNYNINELISYADICWSNGNLYKQLGFTYIKDTKPNYWWVIDNIKSHRFNWRKDKLQSMNMLLENETEVSCMHRLGHYRIYDTGSQLWNYIK